MLENEIRHRLLDEFQRDFPLTPRPYETLGMHLGLCEADVITALEALLDEATITRIGAVIAPNAVGVSLLAALMIPEDQLESVAHWISACPEVNHNYQREHDYNLWFVVTASNQTSLDLFFGRLSSRWPYPLLRLPLVREFHIDLGFSLSTPTSL